MSKSVFVKGALVTIDIKTLQHMVSLKPANRAFFVEDNEYGYIETIIITSIASKVLQHNKLQTL